MAVSPDGKSVYGVGYEDDAIVSFGRETDGDGDGLADGSDNCPGVSNAGQQDSDGDDTGDACETGTLTYASCLRDAPGGFGCGSAEGLFGAALHSVSLDGKHIYVPGQFDDTVVTLSRNATTGAMARVEEDRDVEAGGSAQGLNEAVMTRVSPDGENVYVTGATDDTIVTFTRNDTTGALTDPSCLRDDPGGGGCGSAEGLNRAGHFNISPDGKHVYVAAFEDDAVVTFSRDDTTGALTRVEEDRDPSSGGTAEGLDGPRNVVVSPDGRHLYATGGSDDAVVAFSRDPDTGALLWLQLLEDVATGGTAEGLDETEGMAISPDGKHVYATGITDDAVVVFSRNPVTGTLAPVQCYRDTENSDTRMHRRAGPRRCPRSDPHS